MGWPYKFPYNFDCCPYNLKEFFGRFGDFGKVVGKNKDSLCNLLNKCTHIQFLKPNYKNNFKRYLVIWKRKFCQLKNGQLTVNNLKI